MQREEKRKVSIGGDWKSALLRVGKKKKLKISEESCIKFIDLWTGFRAVT